LANHNLPPIGFLQIPKEWALARENRGMKAAPTTVAIESSKRPWSSFSPYSQQFSERLNRVGLDGVSYIRVQPPRPTRFFTQLDRTMTKAVMVTLSDPGYSTV